MKFLALVVALLVIVPKSYAGDEVPFPGQDCKEASEILTIKKPFFIKRFVEGLRNVHELVPDRYETRYLAALKMAMVQARNPQIMDLTREVLRRSPRLGIKARLSYLVFVQNESFKVIPATAQRSIMDQSTDHELEDYLQALGEIPREGVLEDRPFVAHLIRGINENTPDSPLDMQKTLGLRLTLSLMSDFVDDHLPDILFVGTGVINWKPANLRKLQAIYWDTQYRHRLLSSVSLNTAFRIALAELNLPPHPTEDQIEKANLTGLSDHYNLPARGAIVVPFTLR